MFEKSLEILKNFDSKIYQLWNNNNFYIEMPDKLSTLKSKDLYKDMYELWDDLWFNIAWHKKGFPDIHFTDYFNETFKEELIAQRHKKTFFYCCSLEVYVNTYNNRKKEYLSNHNFSNEVHFIEQEAKIYKASFEEYNYASEARKYFKLYKLVDNKEKDELNRCRLNIQDFLEERAHELGYKLKFKVKPRFKLKKAKKQSEVFLPEENELNGKLTKKEKIIILKELGILDLLSSRNDIGGSINLIAQAIGLFTEIKYRTIQSYINPMLSNSATDDKNRADKDEDTVKKIKNILRDIKVNI